MTTNYYDLLQFRAGECGDKIFLQVDNDKYTYAEFLKLVDECEIDSNLIADKDFLAQSVKFFAAQRHNKKPVLLHGDIRNAVDDTGGVDDVLGVLTSGTTGNPKIYYRSYQSWAGFFAEQNKIFGVDTTSKLFLHGSLSFTGNLNVFLAVMYAGGTVITSRSFGLRTWLKLIEAATNIYLVPTKLRLLTPTMPLTNIRNIFSGSQILTASQSLSLLSNFPNAELILYYGASELNYITYKKICAANVDEVDNLGKPFSGVKVDIRDGLIYVDTKFHVSGITTPYSVGDYGHFDADGNLIFEGRGNDFINRGGYKLSASNIEMKLMSIAQIRAAAVVKVHDDIRGDDFQAYVVADCDVRKKIRQTLMPIEMPSKIIFVDELPLNDRGKVDKSRLV